MTTRCGRLRTAVTVTALMTGLVASAPPAYAQNRDQQQLLAELRIMQEQTQRLQLSLNALTDQVRDLKTQVKDVNDHLDLVDRQSTKGFADSGTQMNGLSKTLTNVQERVADNSVRLQQFDQEIGPIRQSLSMLTETITQMQSPAMAGGAGSAAGSTGGATAPTLAASPKAYYDTAFGFYTGGDYTSAIKAFQEFLKQFASAPNACAAQYYIGKSHVGLKQYAEAIQDFDVVIKTWPGTDCEPDAYVEQGLAYLQLKQTEKARANFKLVIQRAVDTPNDRWGDDAALARDYLAQIKG